MIVLKPTTTRSYILKTLNIDILKCHFADCIENSSWTALPLTEGHIKELKDSIKELKSYNCTAKAYSDELILVEYFRTKANDEILVYIDGED
jgi:hypothetical protein